MYIYYINVSIHFRIAVESHCNYNILKSLKFLFLDKIEMRIDGLCLYSYQQALIESNSYENSSLLHLLSIFKLYNFKMCKF